MQLYKPNKKQIKLNIIYKIKQINNYNKNTKLNIKIN